MLIRRKTYGNWTAESWHGNTHTKAGESEVFFVVQSNHSNSNLRGLLVKVHKQEILNIRMNVIRSCLFNI